LLLLLFFYFHRADAEGLSQQKRLEGLVARYKSLIPVIEATILKLDVYSRSYAFRQEVQKVMEHCEQDRLLFAHNA
jgi:hypothetical protein